MTKKWIILCKFLFANLICYLILISAYARCTNRPLFFPVSCIMAVILPIGLLLVFRRENLNKICDQFSQLLMVMVGGLILILFATFGPAFIDRSISYHLAFLSVERGSFNKNDLEKSLYTRNVFEKRFEDAREVGFIKQSDFDENTFEPTLKAKLFTYTLIPLGELTDSLQEYKALKYDIGK